MEKQLYNALSVLFNNSLIEDTKKFITGVMNGLINVFNDTNATQYFTIFTAAAASLMIIFYFIDLADNASKDMITLERLVISFIKLLFGFTIMLYLPQIINGLFGIIRAVYDQLSDLSNSQIDFGVTFFGQENFPAYEDVEGQFDGMDKNFGKILAANFHAIFISLIVTLVGFAARLAAYFVAISNAVTLITRAVFSPLAVAQCFEDGQKSNAIRFLKKFAADGLAFAVILGILYAGSLLQGNIATAVLNAANLKDINGSTAFDVLANWNVLGGILVVNVAVIGASMKAPSIAQDIVGAH